MTSDYIKGKQVVSRDGRLVGLATGGYYHCKLEGCNGHRIGVRWPDKKITFPCTEGMTYSEVNAGEWRIT